MPKVNKMTVEICYPTCQKCTTNKGSLKEEQFLQDFKTNFYPLDTESNIDEYNCYSKFDA